MEIKPLIKKYSTAGPRYTSYPTAPQWINTVTAADYEKSLSELPKNPSLGLYVHIPFCDSLCYYCGCNIKISKDTSVSEPYLQALLKEIQTTRAKIGRPTPLHQVSWGGGTPTYFTPDQIERLHRAIETEFTIHPDAEISMEIDPRVTSKEQLKLLRKLGFNRLSLGVQDFNSEVQQAVNRIQPKKMTAEMVQYCRDLGVGGVNIDLIYGLPHQTVETFKSTLADVLEIGPDRIAFYNYAHLPSLRPHQKILEKLPMPNAEERTEIFLLALKTLGDGGYRAIGMDHFAKRTDELSSALDSRSLYRNFMGYTVKKSGGLIGLGASAIGEIPGGYYQNVREHHIYEENIQRTGFATLRGFHLSEEDKKRKWIIQNLMCQFWLSFPEYRAKFGQDFPVEFAEEMSDLSDMETDGLVKLTEEGIEVTETGRLFNRNIAMKFDAYLKTPSTATYSRTV